MDTTLSKMSGITNREADVNGLSSNERTEVGDRALAEGSLNGSASISGGDDVAVMTKQVALDPSLTSLLPKRPLMHPQMPTVLHQVMDASAAPAPTGPVPTPIAPATGAVIPGLAQVPNSLSPTPISVAALPGSHTATTGGGGAMPDMTAFAGTTAQQQFIWQQALQSLNLLTAQQQQQAPFLNAPNAPGIPLHLGGLQAMIPSLPAGGQQQPTQSVAPTRTIMPMPTMASPPGTAPHNENSKRVSLGSIPSNERNAKRIKVAPPPSVISSYDGNVSEMGPPIKMSDAELEKLTPAERRRYERNLREQQRSYKISQQIKSLRDVLTESNIPFKPNKYSILVCVTNYIKELQARSIMLDADHNRLRDTIKQTNELVVSGQIPSSDESSNNNMNKDAATTTSASVSSSSDTTTPDFLMVQGIDFKAAFKHCPYALGVCSLDGRILTCNPSFEKVMGCDEGEMEEQSLFLYIRNHQEIFEAMADLLKRSSIASETGVETVKDVGVLYWCGTVVSSNELDLSLSITLTTVANGIPKFFSFSIASAG